MLNDDKPEPVLKSAHRRPLILETWLDTTTYLPHRRLGLARSGKTKPTGTGRAVAGGGGGGAPSSVAVAR